MPTFDFHQHLWPDAFVERLRERRRPPFLRDSVLTTTEGAFAIDLDEHRLDRRLSILEANGIDVAVVSLQPTLGFEALPPYEREPLVAAYHGGIREVVAASAGRLVALAAGQFQPDFPGVCLGASQLLHADGLAHLLDPLDQDGGFLFIHPDNGFRKPATPDWWVAVAEYTAGMQGAYLAWLACGVHRWPRLKVVFAMLAGGGPFQLDRLRSRGVETERLTSIPVFFETSSYGRVSLELCLATYGVDRLIYGSDFPVLHPASTMGAIQALGKATSHAICERNPRYLLDRPPRNGSGRAHRPAVSVGT